MDDKRIDEWYRKRKERKEFLSAENLLTGILKQDMQSLSAAITLLESTREEDRAVAGELVQRSIAHATKSIRIGITGVPGVGKSTFIESFGKLLVEQGKRIAILAIDPSSAVSGGSILGDKTRMQELSMLPEVFIRPSPAGKTLGGVARKTRESIYLCEAAGFDVVLIETVGVGQSETVVHSMVDFFLLLMLAGAGDELQGIKRGIMEMADALVITKADGENVKRANLARREYQNAMHLFPPKQNEWIPQSLTCSSLQGTNIDAVWQVIESFERQTLLNGSFNANRRHQDRFWFKETLEEMILSGVYADPELVVKMNELLKSVEEGRESSFSAAEKLYHLYRSSLGHGRI